MFQAVVWSWVIFAILHFFVLAAAAQQTWLFCFSRPFCVFFLFSWLLVSTGVPASDSCLSSLPGMTFAFRRTLLQLNTLVFPSIHHKNCGCLYCIYHVHICSLLVTVFRALQLCQKLLPSQKPAIYDHLQTFLQIIHREEKEQQWICVPLLRPKVHMDTKPFPAKNLS